MRVRTKTWIENESGELLFGKGKTEILELIEEEGSIAGAAERMVLNYKKAWNHIKTLQGNFSEDLVIVQKGVKGGTFLTPEAKDLIKKYRRLQKDIETYANRRFQELFPSDSDSLHR
ncbi:winged helix-turn-helix domain-containing protein [Desulforhopalus singaporensis]|uniref:ModE molybdate transport repressor domain-containing protein n=1 Tax=Desulforhopalus singaporensis TaxID=91360 RepID=A0A1H0SSN9_9BACT|nr:LysR family transcriptional regulator [Desulforhopalus singaporensis]SDP44733.1 ModE molybdate transport repressor domain-containing protein [Desulforhopalus singaporensis]